MHAKKTSVNIAHSSLSGEAWANYARDEFEQTGKEADFVPICYPKNGNQDAKCPYGWK